MFYPLNKDCPTQPRIDISDITLRNITSTGGYLPAGILRCNETNPCTNIVFENVDVRSSVWDTLHESYITENVHGTATGSFPHPSFNSNKNNFVAGPLDMMYILMDKFLEIAFLAEE